jgi:hypothetical protein
LDRGVAANWEGDNRGGRRRFCGRSYIVMTGSEIIGVITRSN